ncbi:thiol:disulfide interchange protein DsbA/DsbL, partial [Azovibrio restrictus]|uniref:thiol:disulfide interchange protein DsbA/DsbL n=1 Tax=Azovibrio restrictus TaxID=146938 RepID=UPI0026E98A42
MKTMMALSALFVGLFCNPLFSPEAAAAAQPGRDYTLVEPLRPVSGGPVEVLDFFSYPSAQCYRQQQSLAQWSAAMPGNVRLVHVPVILDPSRDESMARLHHTLQFLEQPDLLHGEIYKEVHVRHLDLNNQLSSKPARLDFIQLLGVSPTPFTAAYHSPEVEHRLAEARKLQQHYQIRDTPTLVVDGRYLIKGLPPERTVQVLQEVIELTHRSTPRVLPPATPVAVAP